MRELRRRNGRSSDEERAPDHEARRGPNRSGHEGSRTGAGNQALLRLLDDGVIRPKLEVGPPDDEYEKEAERVAEAVMRMPEPEDGRPPSVGVDRGRDETPGVQRMCSRCRRRYREGEPLDCEECEEELRRSPRRTRSSGGTRRAGGDAVSAAGSRDGSGAVSADVEAKIEELRGGGRPLPASVRSYFEPRFGEDFGGVRIHTDAGADEAARSVDAEAFTLGRDVVFQAGAYRPGTARGRRLLAHELAHVVQTHGPPRAGTADRRQSGAVGSPLVRRQETDRTAETTGPSIAAMTGIEDGAVFNGSSLIVIRDSKVVVQTRAVSGKGGEEWEKNVGPIPEGRYTIKPHKTNSPVTTIEAGTGGANRIDSGYQRIDVDELRKCHRGDPQGNEPGWGYCRPSLECWNQFSRGDRCWNTESVWGQHRIKIETGRPSGRVNVEKPSGETVTRFGFYIHGGYRNVAVTSGCVKVFDNRVFTELRKFSEAVPFVVR
jgi:hypothetical protein